MKKVTLLLLSICMTGSLAFADYNDMAGTGKETDRQARTEQSQSAAPFEGAQGMREAMVPTATDEPVDYIAPVEKTTEAAPSAKQIQKTAKAEQTASKRQSRIRKMIDKRIEKFNKIKDSKRSKKTNLASGWIIMIIGAGLGILGIILIVVGALQLSLGLAVVGYILAVIGWIMAIVGLIVGIVQLAKS